MKIVPLVDKETRTAYESIIPKESMGLFVYNEGNRSYRWIEGFTPEPYQEHWIHEINFGLRIFTKCNANS